MVDGKDPFAGLLPGSQEAVDAGCICPVEANNHGKGRPAGDGLVTFTQVERCHIHGPGIQRRNRLGAKVLDDAMGKGRVGWNKN